MIYKFAKNKLAMATTADFKNGMCFRHNSDIVQIIEFQHVKPGKGPAFVRTKLRSLNSGKILDVTFNSGVKVEPVRVERRVCQYLYNDEQGYHFMNNADYEQFFLDKKLINSPQFLVEGAEVEIMYNTEDEQPMSCELKPHIELEVTYTEPAIKGDSVNNNLKPATLETGAEIKVPLFINTGDKIRINTATGEYMERVNTK
jgi:elongation factor P